MIQFIVVNQYIVNLWCWLCFHCWTRGAKSNRKSTSMRKMEAFCNERMANYLNISNTTSCKWDFCAPHHTESIPKGWLNKRTKTIWRRCIHDRMICTTTSRIVNTISATTTSSRRRGPGPMSPTKYRFPISSGVIAPRQIDAGRDWKSVFSMGRRLS